MDKVLFLTEGGKESGLGHLARCIGIWHGLLEKDPDAEAMFLINGDEQAEAFLKANKMNVEDSELVTVAGKCCETGDILRKDVPLPPIESGDVLAVFVTGAYNYTMASNYNRLPIPGVMLVNKGTTEWIIKPQSYEDLLRNDIVPSRLK